MVSRLNIFSQLAPIQTPADLLLQFEQKFGPQDHHVAEERRAGWGK